MGSSKGVEYHLPLLKYSFENGNKEQMQYCIKLRDNFAYTKPIRYVIFSPPKVAFKILFILKKKTYIIQETFDNSDETLRESLNKFYKLLDREYISRKSNNKKKKK